MYVACRHLKLSVPGEGGTTRVVSISPGEQIPGAELWPYPNIIAHLNLGLMKWDGDIEANAPHSAHRQRGGVVIPLIFKKMAPKGTYKLPAEEIQAGPQPPEAPGPGVSTVPPAPGELTCGACGGRQFKSALALKNHNRFKHPEQPKAG